jgi:murein L,D-transpeptidase YcbB/YkuD
MRNNQPFWFGPGDTYERKRVVMLNYLRQADSLGLVPSRYLGNGLSALQAGQVSDQPGLLRADYRLTDAAISICKDLYQGCDINSWVSYDGISSKCAEADNAYLLRALQAAEDPDQLTAFLNNLEPQCEGYAALKAALRTQLAGGKTSAVRQITTSLNYYRWVRHFHFDSFIVINIPSATLDYYRGDSIELSMKAVLGKPETRTPRFAAYVKEVTLYPYWNMPRSILVNEWLPAFRKNPALISFLGMEIIDARGRIVKPSAVNWAGVSGSSFPYRIRQKTGCQNPMGVVKFSLTSPFDVYLHDTNFKGAFLSGNRYYSHGCIRVEEPLALADAMLLEAVDAGFLQACYKDQQPQVLPLPGPVPVFVVYMCAEADTAGEVRYYKDVYGLLK